MTQQNLPCKIALCHYRALQVADFYTKKIYFTFALDWDVYLRFQILSTTRQLTAKTLPKICKDQQKQPDTKYLSVASNCIVIKLKILPSRLDPRNGMPTTGRIRAHPKSQKSNHYKYKKNLLQQYQGFCFQGTV